MILSRVAQMHPEAPLEPVIAMLGAAFEDLRRVSRGLRPVALEGRTLPEALAALAADVERASGVRISVEARLRMPLRSDAEVHLHRLAAEALANVARHSGARSAKVRLAQDAAGATTLTIEDDGAGFDAARTEGRGGGLLGMAERADLLGAHLEIDARPGRGARIEVRLPASAGAGRTNEPPARPTP